MRTVKLNSKRAAPLRRFVRDFRAAVNGNYTWNEAIERLSHWSPVKTAKGKYCVWL